MQKRAHANRCASLPEELEVENAGWWYADIDEGASGSDVTAPKMTAKI